MLRILIPVFVSSLLFAKELAAQTDSFFEKSQLSISYNTIHSWHSLRAVQLRPNQNRSNEVESFSMFFSHDWKNKFTFQLEYHLDRVQHIDLRQVFFNSSYFLKAGYKFKINQLNELRPRIGFGVINHVLYETWTVQVGGPETRTVTHFTSGKKEPFRQWTIGMDYRHDISKTIFVGLGLDVVYNFNFERGRTYLSPYLGFALSALKKKKAEE